MGGNKSVLLLWVLACVALFSLTWFGWIFWAIFGWLFTPLVFFVGALIVGYIVYQNRVANDNIRSRPPSTYRLATESMAQFKDSSRRIEASLDEIESGLERTRSALDRGLKG